MPGTRQWRRLAGIQNRIARAFGIAPADRTASVAKLLTPSRDRAGYWLQLLLSMTIATLGLVLDSTAVVIGAMLVSPLMGPIVGLGMGLAIGSPFLVLRSFGRTLSSVALVVGGATALTLLLPFHQVTAEVSSRTAPTALDLGVAICCAVAAAYALIRPGSDTATTAAGTAVGIALVPPLCVVGYGLGTRSLGVASGSSLLFVANFCAILFFAVLAFTVLGYGLVDTRALEHDELAGRNRQSRIVRSARWLGDKFDSTYGAVLRVAMPLALLAAVFLPLRRALGEVSWEIRVRSAIESLVNALPETRVRSTIAVKHHDVVVHLVTVGSHDTAEELRSRLAKRIEAIAGVTPTVDVVAVPDDLTLRTLAAELTPRAEAPPQHAGPPSIEAARASLETLLHETWPTDAAGPLVRWRTSLTPGGVEVQVVHIGAPLGKAGEAMLAAALAAPVGSRPVIVDEDLPRDRAVVATREEWLARVVKLTGQLGDAPGVFTCLETPHGREGTKGRASLDPLGARDAGAVSIVEGTEWSVRVATEPCDERDDSGTDGDRDGAVADAAPVRASDAAPEALH